MEFIEVNWLKSCSLFVDDLTKFDRSICLIIIASVILWIWSDWYFWNLATLLDWVITLAQCEHKMVNLETHQFHCAAWARKFESWCLNHQIAPNHNPWILVTSWISDYQWACGFDFLIYWCCKWSQNHERLDLLRLPHEVWKSNNFCLCTLFNVLV